MEGHVNRLVREKGFGFIRSTSGEDLFFHRSECKDMFDDLNEHDRVEYEREDTTKGPRANRVRLIEE